MIVGAWAVSFSLMALASPDLYFWSSADGQEHEIAQGYGAFLWAGVLLYATVAWRVWARRSDTPSAHASSGFGPPIPRSHLSASPESVVTI
jgi:alpha-1,2-mannosyltransferase